MDDSEARFTIRVTGGLMARHALSRAMHEEGVHVVIGASDDGPASHGFESISAELLGDVTATCTLVVQGAMPRIKSALAKYRQRHSNSSVEVEDEDGMKVSYI